MFTTVAVAAALTAQFQQPPFKHLRWEREIATIEKRLADHPPPEGGVVFAGSSSIRLWKLAESFPDLPAANVGFGGSQIPACTHFAPRLIFPLKPRAVVFYCGDNDVNAGRTPEQVRDDFVAFAAAVHAEFPKCHLYYLPIKPSPSRWEQFERQSKANALVKEVCTKGERFTYVDLVAPLLGPDGRPIPEMYVKDQLHLSAKGYAKWAKVLGPLLK